jgi:hypothetical protein
MAVLFGIVFVGFGRQIYGALGGSGEALDRAEAFATILFTGCIAHWIANSMASVLRGTGDMKTPGLALVVTAGIQIPLTGALTLGWFGLPAFGIRGPAIAAVIAFALAAVWMLSKLTGPKAPLRLRWPVDGFRWRSFRDILKVGLVACLVVILTNGTVLVVTGLIGREGDRRHRGLWHRFAARIHADPDQFRHRRDADGAGRHQHRRQAICPRPAHGVDRRLHGGRRRRHHRPHRGAVARPVARPLHQQPRRACLGPPLSQHRGTLPTASSASPWRSTSPRRVPARWSGRSPPTSPASP